MDYYRIVMNQDPEYWVVGLSETFDDGSLIDIWAYRQGKFLRDPKRVPLIIRHDGEPADCNLCTFGPLVASNRSAELCAAVLDGGIQRIPASIRAADDEPVGGEWEVLNILHVLDCLDRERSSITYYPQDHDRAGKPRSVDELYIKADATDACHLFRVMDWNVAIIVSEFLRDRFETEGITGVDYVSVTW